MAVINLKSQTDLSGFYIIYKGSVQNEKSGIFGISHLMEHLVYKSIDFLIDEFDRYGISNNAYTTDTEIVFYITGLDEYVNKYKNIILEKLLTFQITEEQFLNERQIVLQEYEMYFDQRTDNHILNLNRKLYNTYSAIGSRQDIKSLTYQDIKDYFKLQFSKPHTIINVSKHNDFKTNIEFSTKKFNNIINNNNNIEIIYEPINLTPGKVSIINISKNIITEDFPYISFITKMLGQGLNSPLYQEIREKKGLVYYISCHIDYITETSGYIMFSSETTDNNIDEFQKTLKEILDNPNKYMTKERFEIIYDAIKISLKKSKINRYNNVNKYIVPKERQIEYILTDLSYNKIMYYYKKYFNFDDLYLSIDSQENFN